MTRCFACAVATCQLTPLLCRFYILTNIYTLSILCLYYVFTMSLLCLGKKSGTLSGAHANTCCYCGGNMSRGAEFPHN